MHPIWLLLHAVLCRAWISLCTMDTVFERSGVAEGREGVPQQTPLHFSFPWQLSKDGLTAKGFAAFQACALLCATESTAFLA